ncbi:hypothetical protein EVAR_66761_1 [Eumeta japonica]|uniref:Uncharacterized protein n=1 Tax=Eumeta variegata TaxID=151549 RepID=A0A4C1Z6A2_EUMVA|nr:hypothetical protein EVAR_66761_1 [Eumeta japonica]
MGRPLLDIKAYVQSWTSHLVGRPPPDPHDIRFRGNFEDLYSPPVIRPTSDVACPLVQVRDGGLIVASCPGVFSSGTRPRRLKWQCSLVGASTPLYWVQVRDGGLTVASCPGVFSSGTRPRRLRWQWSVLDPLIDILPEPSRRPHAGARGHCAGAGRWRGSGVGWCSTRGGRHSSSWTRSRPPVVGRWWTPTGSRRHASVTRVGVDLTERACRPLIAIHASDGSSQGSTCQRAVSLNLFFSLALVVVSIRCLRWTTRGARHRMRSASGGAPGCEEVVSEGGREARNRPYTQPTAGGRTLVDADRIKAARIGDPRWRRSNRARLPTADQAIHASDGGSQGSTCQRAASFTSSSFSDHPSSSSFFLRSVFNLQSGAYAGPPAARASCACARRRWGHRVAEWLTRAGEARLSHACVSEPVSFFSLRPSSGSSFRSTRAPKHRFTRIIVPTMSG